MSDRDVAFACEQEIRSKLDAINDRPDRSILRVTTIQATLTDAQMTQLLNGHGVSVSLKPDGDTNYVVSEGDWHVTVISRASVITLLTNRLHGKMTFRKESDTVLLIISNSAPASVRADLGFK